MIVKNLTIRDYTPYHNTFEFFAVLSWLYRAARHVKKYRYVLLARILLNFLYEQIASGLSIVWFSTVAVSCPVGWMQYVQIDPFIWQSVMMCLNHALPISISHLYFHRLKSAIWPHKYYDLINRIGTGFYIFIYFIGVLVFPFQVYNSHSRGPEDRILYGKFFIGLPDFYWSPSCYVSANSVDPTLLPFARISTYSSGVVVLLQMFCVYVFPIVTVVVIINKFHKLRSRNARVQKNLLYALIVQTLVFFAFYIVPNTIGQSSMFDKWWNPLILQLMLFLAQIHGSLVTITTLATNKSFRDDVKMQIFGRKSAVSCPTVFLKRRQSQTSVIY